MVLCVTPNDHRSFSQFVNDWNYESRHKWTTSGFYIPKELGSFPPKCQTLLCLTVEIPGLWEIQSPVTVDEVVEGHKYYQFMKEKASLSEKTV